MVECYIRLSFDYTIILGTDDEMKLRWLCHAKTNNHDISDGTQATPFGLRLAEFTQGKGNKPVIRCVIKGELAISPFEC